MMQGALIHQLYVADVVTVLRLPLSRCCLRYIRYAKEKQKTEKAS